jgi:hypothetical protein
VRTSEKPEDNLPCSKCGETPRILQSACPRCYKILNNQDCEVCGGERNISTRVCGCPKVQPKEPVGRG